MSNNIQTQYYHWKNYKCAYNSHNLDKENNNLALILIHPIGVGLSGIFWQRFIEFWLNNNHNISIYNPDLLGCGNSDFPPVAYYPEDWANQLAYFINNIVKKPVVLVIQGALFPVGIYLVEKMKNSDLIKGLILSGPPSWSIMTKTGKIWQQKLLWNILFDSLFGRLLYFYVRRRQFIQSFSIRQLFAEVEAVDNQWLDNLEKEAKNSQTRYAVFAFLAGFWRQDYTDLIRNIQKPTLVLVGEKASSISKEGLRETPEQRIELYLKNLPNAIGKKIPGRNVLPYESTENFGQEVINFLQSIHN